MPKPNKQTIIDGIIKMIEQGTYNFSKEIPKHQFYVYALINPIDNKVFYIGKGKGKRVFMHGKGVDKNQHKNDVIVSIMVAGMNYSYFILHVADNEKEAFIIEDILIRRFALSLTNISGAKEKAPARWLEKAGRSVIRKGKELVKEIRQNGKCLCGDIYFYKGEWHEANLYRPDITGRFIKA